jgi:hypothetical protein
MVAMEPDANPASPASPSGAAGPSPDDLAALAAYAAALADGVEAALAGWVERSVERLHVERTGRRPSVEVRAAGSAAGAAATAAVAPRVRALLALDVDDQRTGPLAIIREAVPFPTAVLREAGVEPVERDEFAARQFPDDVYDLAPATFADLDPDLHETGLVWGAAKAHVHLARRRADGHR